MNKRILKKVSSVVAASCFLFSGSVFAATNYKVNMRVAIKGQSPISVNTVAKPGKKSFISQFSDDGQTETLVTVIARKSQVNKKDGLAMDVQVTRRVRGQEKASERAHLFAPENEEMEFGVNSKGRTAGNLSLAVMAHKL